MPAGSARPAVSFDNEVTTGNVSAMSTSPNPTKGSRTQPGQEERWVFLEDTAGDPGVARFHWWDARMLTIAQPNFCPPPGLDDRLRS